MFFLTFDYILNYFSILCSIKICTLGETTLTASTTHIMLPLQVTSFYEQKTWDFIKRTQNSVFGQKQTNKWLKNFLLPNIGLHMFIPIVIRVKNLKP